MDDEFQQISISEWIIEYMPWIVDQQFLKSLNILRSSIINEISDDHIEKIDVFFELLVQLQEEKMYSAHQKFQQFINNLSVRINIKRNCVEARMKSNYPELYHKDSEKNHTEIQEIIYLKVQNQQQPMINEFTENAIDEFRKQLRTRNHELSELKQQIQKLDQDEIIKKYIFDI